jgi:leader peptidase (prepilin peptidase)/N-methyltransferase
MIIPDAFVYAWIAAGVFIQALIIFSVGFGNVSVLDIFAGPILFLFFGSLWYFSNGTAMGFGDAKLGLAMGLTLGFSRGIASVILGFWIGAAIGIILMILSKFRRIHSKIGFRTEVPFGPFLIIGFFLSLFLNLDLVWMSGLFAF